MCLFSMTFRAFPLSVQNSTQMQNCPFWTRTWILTHCWRKRCRIDHFSSQIYYFFSQNYSSMSYLLPFCLPYYPCFTSVFSVLPVRVTRATEPVLANSGKTVSFTRFSSKTVNSVKNVEYGPLDLTVLTVLTPNVTVFATFDSFKSPSL